jgi:flagellar hook-associated protein 3 FlgL
MRIADKMQFGQVQRNLNENRAQMSNLQNQAATQKRINKPSDDPLASARVLNSRTEERGNAQFIKNINQAKSFIEFSEQSLSELNDILVRAKELAVAQSSDASANEESRRVVGSEVEQIFNQAIQIGNRKLGERYIFGGYKTQNAPFNSFGDYQGDDGDIKIQIQKDAFVGMNLPGSKVFLGKGLGGDGVARTVSPTPHTVEELEQLREEESRVRLEQEVRDENFVHIRGPASPLNPGRMSKKDPVTQGIGINVFSVLKGLENSLKTNDKQGVQLSLEELDQAINQVVLGRAEMGSRVMVLNLNVDSIQKAIVDNKILASTLEDADVFQVVSDMNRTDSTLRATLETSGKLIQQSLMDFIK